MCQAAVRILQVAKNTRPGRTGLHAGRQLAGIHAVMAEETFGDNFQSWVKVANAVGTGGLAGLAADTTMGIHQHDPVFPLIGRFDRTDRNANRRLTLVAVDGQMAP